MPFALLLMGILAFVAAYRNTLPQLGALLKGDFSGKGNFFYWMAALILVGSLGYFKPLQNSSRMFILLILVIMILSDKGFFAQFVAALNQPAPAANPVATGNAPPAISGSGGNSSGGASNAAEKAAVSAAEDTMLGGGNPFIGAAVSNLADGVLGLF